MLHLNYECPECCFKIPFEFLPSRPAPYCNNPNSPNYADAGDDCEIECEFEYCPNCGTEITEKQLEDCGNKEVEEIEDDEL